MAGTTRGSVEQMDSPWITCHSGRHDRDLPRVHFKNLSAGQAHGMSECTRDPFGITALVVARKHCVDFDLKDVGVGFCTQ